VLGVLLPFIGHGQANQVTLKIKDNAYLPYAYLGLSAKESPEGLMPANKVAYFIDREHYDIIGKKPDGSGTIKMPAAILPYYKLGGLELYIQPGEVLIVDLKDKPRPCDALFYGKDAAANKWLNQELLMDYRVSYMQQGILLDTLKSYSTYREDLFESIRHAKLELHALHVNGIFKRDGEARLRFLAINALMNYINYSAYYKYESKRTEDTVRNKKLMDLSAVFIKSKQDSLTRDIGKLLSLPYLSEYNDLPEVVSTLQSLAIFNQINHFKITLPSAFAELHQVIESVDNSAATGLFFSDKAEIYANSLQEKDLIEAIHRQKQAYRRLQPGQQVIDAEMQDTSGKIVKLSDLAGKALYIDVWATWCSPCVALKPYFEQLAEQHQDKNITFISISIDQDIASWKAYLAAHKKPANVQQYVIVNKRAFTSSYQMQNIPRFILIDSSFKFISALTHAPDSPAILPLLNALTVNN